MNILTGCAARNFVVPLLLGSFITIGHAQDAVADSIVQVTAEAQGLSLMSPVDVPEEGTFWLVMSNGMVPDPALLFDPSLPVYQMTDGQYLVDATEGQVDMDGQSSVADALAAQASAVVDLINQIQNPPLESRSLAMRAMDLDFTPDFSFPTNGLWLQIMDVTNGQADLILNNATDSVYEIFSKTDLTLTNWNIEAEVWPTDTNAMPFTVPVLDRTNLFVWARDWTGITSDGNTTPEWWFWKYYGTVDLSDTNLDSMGNTFLDDYTYGVDPNVIQFSLQFTNTFLNTSAAYGTVTILGGTPFYEAILINDTNLADAQWQPYTSSNVTVNLDSGNGLYNVMFGLRGLPADGQQTWQYVPMTLYSVPLDLTITSPTNSTVCQPLIQLQGYTAEALDSLTFDVSNAAGVFTNQTGYITSQFYDTNLLEFTTNYFQCYLLLTNGVNAITLHATDLASNTVTTNVSITFDPSTDTNPPAFALVWPQNNATIGGSDFTVQAQVSDPTALVTATINGDSVQGIVEQSGLVWVKNLPLSSGTNMVTLSATNIAGVASTTNFNVVQSPVILTIDPISSDQQNQASVTVTGAISDSNDVVVVNGKQATVYDDGTWEADEVPVSPVGTAVVNVSAGADTNDLDVAQAMIQPQPATVELMSYYDTSHIYGSSDGNIIGFIYGYENDSVNWFYTVGGDDNYMEYNSVAATEEGNGFTYETDSYPAGENAVGAPWEYADLSFDLGYYDIGGDYDVVTGPRATKTRVMIEPAGQTPAGTTSLYLVSVGAMEFSNPNQDNFHSRGYGDVPHPPEWMQIQGQTLINSGITNADGSVMGLALVSGTAGVPTDVTPIFTQFYSNRDATFNDMSVTNVNLQIIDANSGTDLTAQTNDVIVGQQMNWYCQLSITNALLNNGSLTNFSWTIPGDAISNYVANSSSGIVYTNFSTTSSNINFYWVDGASNRTIQCSATVDGKTVTGQATFNVLRPTGQIAAFTGTVAVDSNYYNGSESFFALHDGTAILAFGMAGILFSNEFVMPSGNNYNYGNTNHTVEWVQEVNSSLRQFQTNTADGTWYERQCAMLTNSVLDSSYAYPQWTSDNSATLDAPAEALDNSTNSVWKTASTSDHFTMWLMFKPAGGQWVPLGTINWNWAGTAVLNTTSTNGNYWSLTGATNNASASSNSTAYPQWNDNIRNHLNIVPE